MITSEGTLNSRSLGLYFNKNYLVRQISNVKSLVRQGLKPLPQS
ncbi:MAG: hypothetical protein RLZZ338_3674 [Cyanobacteriota bacterium]|jgi:hypothetical protein